MSKPTFSFHSPADLLQEHIDHEMWASEDYAYEAYGHEARMLAAQDQAEIEEMHREDDRMMAEARGITVEALHAERELRVRNQNERAKWCEVCKLRLDPIPF